MKPTVGLKVKARLAGTLIPRPDMPMDVAVAAIARMGHKILDVDYDNRRIKILDQTEDALVLNREAACPQS